MWTEILVRARRYIPILWSGTAGNVVAPDEPPVLRRLEFALSGAALDGYVATLAEPGQPHARPASPARVAAAISAAIERSGGQGHPTVTRSPAALHTLEYWRVTIEAADERAAAVVQPDADARRGGAR